MVLSHFINTFINLERASSSHYLIMFFGLDMTWSKSRDDGLSSLFSDSVIAFDLNLFKETLNGVIVCVRLGTIIVNCL